MKVAVLGFLLALGLLAQGTQDTTPKVKVLTPPEDPTQKTVLVGRVLVGEMIILFEIEPAKAMWMQMGTPPSWMEHPPAAAEKYHLEVKPIDPKSKTRVSYAEVKIKAINTANNRTTEGDLHPMWGSSGLHYAINSALAGDGIYRVQVMVEPPTFGRATADKDLWRKPLVANFHFKLVDGKLAEVSVPEVDL